MAASHPPPAGPPRFIGAVFGFAFAGIGLTIIGFLWTARGFGESPLVFKLFGSFIALVFVAAGGTTFVAAIRGRPLHSGPTASGQSPAAPGTGYTCPACGARLGEDADVSPKGDVKCGYCRKWFSIHG
jgi:hypothetical protein